MGVKVAISIDGDSAEANDRVRGNGVFIKAISALEMCKELGIATSLYTVVTSLNFDRLEKVGEIAKKFGCESIRFNELDLRGRARESVVDLSLSEEQRRQLPEKIGNVVSSVFGEELVKTDDGCWADGSSLYMSADGNVYKCSELFQQCPERPLGNIRSISLDTLKAWDSDVVDRNIGCCYDVYMSQHAVFVGNSTSLCGLVKDQKEITTLEELYTELELLYADITQYCRECQDPDCVGFVWLLDKENARLYDLGVPLVETDNGSSFIHSFPEKESGVLDVSVRGPACSQLCKDVRMCGIHENRPLVCRIYPVGLETAADGRIVWALHTDCHYVRRMAELNILSEFERRAMVLLNRMSRQLESQIVEKYRKVMSISVFPDGDNKYKTLQEVRHE
jgi:Fe-S-cluster containining protein